MHSNPNQGVVNINTLTNFGKIVSVCSQDISAETKL